MAIIKYPYELSVWKEELTGEGTKKEEKVMIIGAHDMNYDGRATAIKLVRKINGTNTLTFQMPNKFFDSEVGDFIENPFFDQVFPERKLKLYYKKKWYEFYVKTVKDDKKHTSLMRTYTCSDSFIDELARNGYGITFDEELYNNVEEIGTFSEQILEDSIWLYKPEYNWGDFTEYTEDKLFKVPTSQFVALNCYKLSFSCAGASSSDIINKSNNKTRKMEMGDDLARQKGIFWDSYDGVNLLKNTSVNLKNSYNYIYIPYSSLNFCYVNISGKQNGIIADNSIIPDRAATEVPYLYGNNYALAPNSVNPNTLIQFIAFDEDEKIEIDEAGLITDKDHHYFMTLEQWNNNISNNLWYIFEDTRYVNTTFESSNDNVEMNYTYKYIAETSSNGYVRSLGNKIITYEGYLGEINDFGTIKGKKISIADRTEMNISKEIDSFVTVYNNKLSDKISGDITYKNLLTSDEGWMDSDIEYRICSRQSTRQILPELARNYIQNGTNIQSTEGWDSMIVHPTTDIELSKPMVKFWKKDTDITTDDGKTATIPEQKGSYLYLNTPDTSASCSVSLVKFIGTDSNHELLDKIAKSYTDRWGAKGTDGWIMQSQTYIRQGGYFYYITYSGSETLRGYFVPNYIYSITSETEAIRMLTKGLFSTEDPAQLRLVLDAKTEDSQNSIRDPSLFSFTNVEDSVAMVLLNRVNKKETSISFNSQEAEAAQSLINFGPVGQEKTIEKNKIYCIGLDLVSLGWTPQSLYIEIGTGGLNPYNNYILTGDTIKIYDNQFVKGNTSADTFNILVPQGSTSFWDDLPRENQSQFSVYGAYDSTGSDAPKKTEEMKTTERYLLFKSNITIENPYVVIKSKKPFLLKSFYLFEAYTKGRDQFSTATYKYSGRELLGNEQPTGSVSWEKGINENYSYSLPWTASQIKERIIFDTDIMPGDSYSYNQYFVQQLYTLENNKEDRTVKDTFLVKSYLSNPNYNLTYLLDSKKYTDSDYEVHTNYLDLSRCPYFISNKTIGESDCSYCSGSICYYQKFGYCPYLFTSEKHCRRVRTLKGEKSNRFNLLQEVSKSFECYPVFNVEYKDESGHIQTDSNGVMQKNIYFITEKGVDKSIGFRYEKNLSNISRSIVSDKIVTKLYVADVDSEYSKTGLCSIKTAEDNPSKDSYIIDFSYYIAKGMMSQNTIDRDLYGINDKGLQGYLKRIGYFNSLYDSLSNKIINLQSSSYNDLEAHIAVNIEGIVEAQGKMREYELEIAKYDSMKESSIYASYVSKYCEQEGILSQLIIDTFFTDGVGMRTIIAIDGSEKTLSKYDFNTNLSSARQWLNQFSDTSLETLFKYWKERHNYTYGLMGQYNKEFKQIETWKKERAKYLGEIKNISLAFFRKYEPYLKEGTWSDTNYITDNAYYHGALDVAAQGAIPKVQYTISVIDLSPKEGEEYSFDLADSTYVEDVSLLGTNKYTGLPNHLKVLISEISEDLDNPTKNSIKVQDFTSQFEDLFSQVTASIQNLTFNENIYRRAKNFNSLHNIEKNSLQGTLDNNNITLVDKNQQNVVIDETGQSGADINNRASKYKLTGQGLYFSSNGGQSWSAGVSPGGGINKDYIKTDTLQSEQLTIGNNKTTYGMLNGDGLTVYPSGTTETSANGFLYGGEKIQRKDSAGNQLLLIGSDTSDSTNQSIDISNLTSVVLEMISGNFNIKNSSNSLFNVDSNGNVTIKGGLSLGGTMTFTSVTKFNIGSYSIAIGGAHQEQVGIATVVNDVVNIGSGGIFALRLFSITKGTANIFTVLVNGIYKGGTINIYPNTDYWNISGGTQL